jgi:hypothetical protein
VLRASEADARTNQRLITAKSVAIVTITIFYFSIETIAEILLDADAEPEAIQISIAAGRRRAPVDL